MNPDLVLHPHTKTHVAQFVANPSHAVLLVGANGVGKTSLAIMIAANVLRLTATQLAQHPYLMHITDDKGSISIDAIRQLQHFLQLKTVGNTPLRRAIIVEHAEALTTEAQNAYLKLLEEPPADTIMILTANNQRALLPTILSRTQLLAVHAPNEQDVKAHFAGYNDVAAVQQAYFLSGGLPGLMHALLAKNTDHPLTKGVTAAKEILQKPTFERLTLVDGLSKQRSEVQFTIEALQRIARAGLDQAAAKQDAGKVKQWHHILSVATEASSALATNANTKLVLDALMLQL